VTDWRNDRLKTHHRLQHGEVNLAFIMPDGFAAPGSNAWLIGFA